MDVEDLRLQRKLLQQQLAIVDSRAQKAAVVLRAKRQSKALPPGIESFAEHKNSEALAGGRSKSATDLGGSSLLGEPRPIPMGGRVEKIRHRALIQRVQRTGGPPGATLEAIPQVAARPKAGAYRKQKVEATMFPTRYSRGELPCSIEHRASGAAKERRACRGRGRSQCLLRPSQTARRTTRARHGRMPPRPGRAPHTPGAARARASRTESTWRLAPA